MPQVKMNEIPADFEEVEIPSNVVPLIPNAERSQIQEPPSDFGVLTFDEIFKLLVEGEEVKIRFTYKGNYESLRASLLRRYKGYKEIKMVLGTDKDDFLQCSCKKIEGSSHFAGGFKVQPSSMKTNGAIKQYEILKDL